LHGEVNNGHVSFSKLSICLNPSGDEKLSQGDQGHDRQEEVPGQDPKVGNKRGGDYTDDGDENQQEQQTFFAITVKTHEQIVPHR
jgi:hypothetical protein